MRIHPVGYRVILISMLLIVTLNLLLVILLSFSLLLLIFIIPSLILFGLILGFFRYPDRKPVLHSPKSVLAAADGLIVAIEDIYDENFFKGPAIQISTFMSPYNVHLNWVPVDATAKEVVYMPGKYLLARNPKSSMLNEMACVSFITDLGHLVVVKQIAGIAARRVIPFLKTGDKCNQGDELGFIRFGSRVDILLPPDAKIFVKIGDKPRGVHTVLAELP